MTRRYPKRSTSVEHGTAMYEHREQHTVTRLYADPITPGVRSVPEHNDRSEAVIKNMEIDTEGYDLSDELKSRIHDRIGGLDEFMNTLDRGRVTVSWEGGPNEQTKIRAQVSGPGQQFDGSDVNWKAETAIDKTRSKLESQIKEAHNKRISKRDEGHRE